jgi:hypothetical protein
MPDHSHVYNHTLHHSAHYHLGSLILLLTCPIVQVRLPTLIQQSHPSKSWSPVLWCHALSTTLILSILPPPIEAPHTPLWLSNYHTLGWVGWVFLPSSIDYLLRLVNLRQTFRYGHTLIATDPHQRQLTQPVNWPVRLLSRICCSIHLLIPVCSHLFGIIIHSPLPRTPRSETSKSSTPSMTNTILWWC